MKCRKFTHIGSFVAAAVLAWGLAARASEAPAYDLCIEQSPTTAGRVTPNSGTHRFSVDSVVALSAEPEPGYQFAYWLGDVTDPASQRTTVHINAPKVVVAVFRPAEKDPFEEEIKTTGGGGGGGAALLPTMTDLSAPGWSPSGGVRTETRSTPTYVPVIVTPEPATVLLVALGALALRRRTRPAVSVPARL